MSSLLAKLFPGNSSSATSSSNSVPDVTSMEALCRAINDLTTQSSDSAGQRAAELTRKNKEMFEKKTNDIEAFLLHCSPAVGSAAMIAAIKAMFDTSFAKGYELGTDRAVELLKHYLDGGELVAAHLQIVPEIIFPLVREVGFYCLEKKDKPEIGEQIVMSALDQLFPRESESLVSPRYVTSCHAALFACALKTRNFELVEPYIEEYIDGICNEEFSEEQDAVSETSAENMPQASSKQANHQNENNEKDFLMSSKKKYSGNNHSHIAFINPKYVFQYLYNGARILIELKKFQRALVLLETCVAIPSYNLCDIQVSAYKKYILISLYLYGEAREITDKSPSVMRMLKGKVAGYKPLLEIRFKRGDNTHTKIASFIKQQKDNLRRDRNYELAENIRLEMRKKAVLEISKVYSSIKISDIKDLANFNNDEESMEVIEVLSEEKRLKVEFTEDRQFVTWEEVVHDFSSEELLERGRLLDELNNLLEKKSKTLNSHPSLSSRASKTSAFNDDEGLSMTPLEA